jgi:hypothetical protein
MASATHDPTSAWTPEVVRQLGLTTDVATAGTVLGIGRTKAYELAKNGRVPRHDPSHRTPLPRPHQQPARTPRRRASPPRRLGDPRHYGKLSGAWRHLAGWRPRG